MDVTLNQVQRQFGDALRRWIERAYRFETRKAIVASAAGVSDAAWPGLGELGLMALPLPERVGGFSGGAPDMLVVMQELGRGLLLEPYWATMFGAIFMQLTDRHGGMLEQVAHYFKRRAMIESTLGDSDHHLQRFMAAPGFRPATPEPTWSNT